MAALADRPALLRRAAIRVWLQDRGATPVSRAHVEELDHAIQVRRGHVWLASGFSARVRSDGLVQLSPPFTPPLAKPQAGEP
jgi:hypothetical protein